MEIVDDELETPILMCILPYGGEAPDETPQQALRSHADALDRQFYLLYREGRKPDATAAS